MPKPIAKDGRDWTGSLIECLRLSQRGGGGPDEVRKDGREEGGNRFPYGEK